MTTISTFDGFIEELHELKAGKENPEEWYFVRGNHVCEYSVNDAERPEDVPEDQSEVPEEMQPATENVDGQYQIGTLGWAASAFEDGINFVGEAGVSDSHDVIDRRVNGLLLVHESVLSEEALGIAHEKEREGQEVDA